MMSLLTKQLLERSLSNIFNTPLERMKWKRMPFGISVAPEEFQRRIDENLEGLEGVKAIADDILIWGDGENIEEATASHDKRCLPCWSDAIRKI